MTYQDEDSLLDLPAPRLTGRHQYANAGAAIRALKAAGFALSEEAIAKGVESVEWPGRLQRLTSGHIHDLATHDTEIWLDGGHNPGAGKVVAEAMANREEADPRPLFVIAGMLNTKEPIGYFEPFAGIARHVFTVPLHTSDAGLDPVALASDAAEAGLSAEAADNVESAMRTIAQTWSEENNPPRILIGGSLYLVGEVLKLNGTPPQ